MIQVNILTFYQAVMQVNTLGKLEQYDNGWVIQVNILSFYQVVMQVNILGKLNNMAMVG